MSVTQYVKEHATTAEARVRVLSRPGNALWNNGLYGLYKEWAKEVSHYEDNDADGFLRERPDEPGYYSFWARGETKSMSACGEAPCDKYGKLMQQDRCQAGRMSYMRSKPCNINTDALFAFKDAVKTYITTDVKSRESTLPEHLQNLPIRGIMLSMIPDLVGYTSPERNFDLDDASQPTILNTAALLALLFQMKLMGYLDMFCVILMLMRFGGKMRAKYLISYALLRIPFWAKYQIWARLNVVTDAADEVPEMFKSIEHHKDPLGQERSSADILDVYTAAFVYIAMKNTASYLDITPGFTYQGRIDAVLHGNPLSEKNWMTPGQVELKDLFGDFKYTEHAVPFDMSPLEAVFYAWGHIIKKSTGNVQYANEYTSRSSAIGKDFKRREKDVALVRLGSASYLSKMVASVTVITNMAILNRLWLEGEVDFEIVATVAKDMLPISKNTILALNMGLEVVVDNTAHVLKLKDDRSLPQYSIAALEKADEDFTREIEKVVESAGEDNAVWEHACTLLAATLLASLFYRVLPKTKLGSDPETYFAASTGGDPVFDAYVRVHTWLVSLVPKKAERAESIFTNYHSAKRQTIINISDKLQESPVWLVLLQSVFVAGFDRSKGKFLGSLWANNNDKAANSTALGHADEVESEVSGQITKYYFLETVSLAKIVFSRVLTDLKFTVGATRVTSTGSTMTHPHLLGESEDGDDEKSTFYNPDEPVRTKEEQKVYDADIATKKRKCEVLKTEGYVNPFADCSNDPAKRIAAARRLKLSADLSTGTEYAKLKAKNPTGAMADSCIQQADVLYVENQQEIHAHYQYIRAEYGYLIYKHIATKREYMVQVAFDMANLGATKQELTALTLIKMNNKRFGLSNVAHATPKSCVFIFIPNTNSVYKFLEMVTFKPFETGIEAMDAQAPAIKTAVRDILWVHASQVAHTQIRPSVLRMTEGDRVFVGEFDNPAVFFNMKKGGIPGDMIKATDEGRQFILPHRPESWTIALLQANDVWGLITSLLHRFGMGEIVRDLHIHLDGHEYISNEQVLADIKIFFDPRQNEKFRVLVKADAYKNAETLADADGTFKRATGKKKNEEGKTEAVLSFIKLMDDDTRLFVIMMLWLAVIEFPELVAFRLILPKIISLSVPIFAMVKDMVPLPTRLKTISHTGKRDARPKA